VAPDVSSHNAAISACGKGRRWEQAFALWEQMREAGVAPSAATLNAVMEALVSASQLDAACDLLQG